MSDNIKLFPGEFPPGTPTIDGKPPKLHPLVKERAREAERYGFVRKMKGKFARYRPDSLADNPEALPNFLDAAELIAHVAHVRGATWKDAFDSVVQEVTDTKQLCKVLALYHVNRREYLVEIFGEDVVAESKSYEIHYD